MILIENWYSTPSTLALAKTYLAEPLSATMPAEGASSMTKLARKTYEVNRV